MDPTAFNPSVAAPPLVRISADAVRDRYRSFVGSKLAFIDKVLAGVVHEDARLRPALLRYVMAHYGYNQRMPSAGQLRMLAADMSRTNLLAAVGINPHGLPSTIRRLPPAATALPPWKAWAAP